MDCAATHVGYGDESSYNIGRFRSVAVVTMPACFSGPFTEEVGAAIAGAGIRELKWNKVANETHATAAEAALAAFFRRAECGEVRADVLIWDTQDGRHAIAGRDDGANLERMYYHLCRCTLRDRWPKGARWELRPDEMASIGWPTLQDVLRAEGFRRGLAMGGVRQAIEEGFSVLSIEPRESHHEPVIQLADLFAGMAAFSFERFKVLAAWHEQHRSLRLIPTDGAPSEFSNRERVRAAVIWDFQERCKARKWGVGLESSHGLLTRNPAQGRVNFWRYVPQHDNDKAPVRTSSGARA